MEINLELLIAIHEIQGKSNNTDAIETYIKNYVVNTLGLTYTTDTYGNIYVTKGTGRNGYKCIVSHVDTVHDLVQDRSIYQHGDILFAFAYDNSSTYTKGYKQVGTGSDDRVGVSLCLQALTDVDDIKVVFYKNEEIGHLGSNASDIEFLNDCNFIVEPDRKGNSDFITTSSGIKMCSIEFENTVKPILDTYKYKVAIGVSTDVDTLKRRGVKVCCFNISCGYYKPHSNSEIVNIIDVHNCYNLILDVWEEHGNTRFEHVYTPPVYQSIYNTTRSFLSRKLGFLQEKYKKEQYTEDFNNRDFRPITQYANFYKYVGNYSITLIDDCPVCKEHYTLRFIPNESVFYCVGKCNNYIHVTNAIKNNIEQHDSKSKETFRYLPISDNWVKSVDAKYNDVTKSYIYSPSFTPSMNYNSYDSNYYPD